MKDLFPWPKPPTGKYLRPLNAKGKERVANYVRWNIDLQLPRRPRPITDGLRNSKSKSRKLKIIAAFIDHVRTNGKVFTTIDAYHWIMANTRSKRSVYRPIQLANLLSRPFYKRMCRYHMKFPRRHQGKLIVYETEE